MADYVGKQLGKYRVLRLLGQGGFSKVYLGEHVYLKTQAAIKVLHTQLAGNDQEGFLNEARIIASLEHPHIVRVLDYGVEESGTPFLVMDYAPNGTLRKYHRVGTPQPPLTILPYVKQVATALQYAHEKKLIHRDVKPENMLLGPDKEVLLSDFGIAMIAHTSYQGIQDVVGTVVYMAPEQLHGRPCPASDQYSLGIVVYEWLCGDRPFRGSFAEIASQHMFTPPPPLHAKIPTIPPDVEQVVLKALAKESEQRFTSIQEFANAMDQACHPGKHRVFASPSVDMPPDQSAQPAAAATPPGASSPVPTSIESPPAGESGKPHPSKGRVSRRTILVGLVGLVAAGSGLTWLATSGKLPFLSPGPKATPSLPPGTLIYTYPGHSDSVNAVVWLSPHGMRIASASTDQTVQVWDATTGSDALTYHSHTGSINGLAESPDGKLIASGGDDKTVQVWDAATGKHILTYQGHSDLVKGIGWSPNGKYIASASADKTVHVWDAATGGQVFTYRHHSDEVLAVMWSPDGKRVASASADNTVQLWDAITGGNMSTYSNHSGPVNGAAWSPNGKYIASGSNDQTVQVWDAVNENLIYTYNFHSDAVHAVAWSPDSKLIASGGHDQTVQIWDATTGSGVFTYNHNAQVNALAWSPDGQRIASGSLDRTIQVRQA